MEKLLKIECSQCGKTYLAELVSEQGTVSGRTVLAMFRASNLGNNISLTNDFVVKGMGCNCPVRDELPAQKDKITGRLKTVNHRYLLPDITRGLKKAADHYKQQGDAFESRKIQEAVNTINLYVDQSYFNED